MATVRLVVEIEDVALTKKMMEDGWLKAHPMPQIFDPDWVDPEDGSMAPLVDKHSSTKELVESMLGDRVTKVINRGLAMIAEETKQVFRRDMIL
jgi:hypothetical protein